MLTPISAMKNFSVLLSVARPNAIPARGMRSVSPAKTDQSEATKSNSKPSNQSPSNNHASPKPARKQGSPPQIRSQFSPPVARRVLQSRQTYRSSTFTTPLIIRESTQTTAKSMALVSPYSISLALPDDIKFKMTHATAMKRAAKNKTDRGN